MRTSRKRKSNARYGIFTDGNANATRVRMPKMLMRAEDSLYIAAVIGGASIFSWIVASL